MKSSLLLSNMLMTLLSFQVMAAWAQVESPKLPVASSVQISQAYIPLKQAKNVARQTAEEINGGLGNYQAELSMHGPAELAPYVQNSDGSRTFTFFGGFPGWTSPTIESTITVGSLGQVTIDYNGPVRNSADAPTAEAPTSTTTTSTTLPPTSRDPNNYTPEADLEQPQASVQTPPQDETTITRDAVVNDVLASDSLAVQNTTPITLRRAKNLARQTAEEANGGLGNYQAELAMHGPAEVAPYVNNADGSFTFSFLGGFPGWTTPSVQSVITVDRFGNTTIDYNGPVR